MYMIDLALLTSSYFRETLVCVAVLVRPMYVCVCIFVCVHMHTGTHWNEGMSLFVLSHKPQLGPLGEPDSVACFLGSGDVVMRN